MTKIIDDTLPTTNATNGYSGNIVTFSAGISGYFDIGADSAQGGGGNAPAGLGVMAGGEIYLAAGAMFEAISGGAGRDATSDSAGSPADASAPAASSPAPTSLASAPATTSSATAPLGSGTTTFNYSGSIQTVTVGTAGYYDITADGAQGGPGVTAGGAGGGYGGGGAIASGEIYLSAGAKLEFIVGGQGSWTSKSVGSGGGGGGGGSVDGGGGGGRIQPTGGNGGGFSAGGAGGVNGAAGQGGLPHIPGSIPSGGGGGGGGYTGGSGGFPSLSSQSGSTAGTSFAGGSGVGNTGGYGGAGGFGGGGGGGAIDGGGGVSIGAGGGGGGSYVNPSATHVSLTAGSNGAPGPISHSGDGLITIVYEGTACYSAGTLIATEHGDIAVEDLHIGDRLLTASGALRPLKWIGNRAYSARFAGANPDLLPIRFKAGSLAENVPARDLLVSPKHAMLLDGVLIPAEHLVNGATVVKEKPGEDIHYFHLELETHDVLIAEGAFSESFVDDDSRAMFQNAHEFGKLYPEERAKEAIYCAPRVEDGYALDRVRRRLAERAGLAYPAATDFGALLGAVERCDHEGVSGWALNKAYPDAPVCLDVIVDGVFAAYAYAQAERPDGLLGFDVLFATPLDPSCPHDIELRRSADGASLGQRPAPAADAA